MREGPSSSNDSPVPHKALQLSVSGSPSSSSHTHVTPRVHIRLQPGFWISQSLLPASPSGSPEVSQSPLCVHVSTRYGSQVSALI
eukprot:902912-Rhodomonas_salina.1